MLDTASLLEVSIDFDQSHLFFPKIIFALIVGMLLLIMVVHRQKVMAILRNPKQELQFFDKNADKFRVFVTIGLVALYLYMMDIVGGYFPNMGMGFLLCSIVFMFLFSLLYAPLNGRKVLITIACNAIIAPLIVWYVLGNLFQITLP